MSATRRHRAHKSGWRLGGLLGLPLLGFWLSGAPAAGVEGEAGGEAEVPPSTVAPAVETAPAHGVVDAEMTVQGDAHAALEARVSKLMRMPMDDPGQMALLLENAPDDVVMAAAKIGQDSGNRLGGLKVILNGLAALLALQPPGYQKVFEESLAAVDRVYLPPDLLNSLDRIVEDLDAERERLREAASLYQKTEGLPLPRKRQLDPTTGELTLYDYGRLRAERKTLVGNEDQLVELRKRYPLLLGEMGVYYGGRQNLTLAFDCFFRCISQDYEVFKANEERFTPPYLAAASFMILSAHRSDDVMALYHLAPMDSKPLQLNVVRQIEARTQIYANAKDEFTNHAQVNQALRDLLYTLIEDEEAIEFLPENDRRRFLEDIGETAIAKRHFQEAIGVYTTLGETKKLVKLGKKLSKTLYSKSGGQAFINRDVAWGIDAFREASASKEMSKLLDRVRDVQADVKAGRLVPDSPELLATYERELDAYVNGGGVQDTLELDTGSAHDDPFGPAPTPPPLTASAEELPRLIHDYARQMTGAVPGEDVSFVRDRLRVLAQQAEEEGRLDLAVEAYQALGGDGDERVGTLVDQLIQRQDYDSAAKLLMAYGPRGNVKLKAIADQILAEGVAPRGVFNPDVLTAVDILIHLDDVSGVEGVLNELLKLRLQFAQLQNQAEIQGRAIANRNLEQLEDAIGRIAAAYDIVGISQPPAPGEGPVEPPPPAPVP